MNPPDWSAVVFAAVPYDGTRPLGCWQLSRVLGRRRPLLYVEPPHSVAHGIRLRPRLRPAGDGSSTYVLTPTTTPGYDRPIAGEAADIFIFRQVRAAAQHCLDGRRAVLVCTPRRGVPRVPHDVLLYWQRDAVALIAQSTSNEWVERRHQQLLRKSDVVTAVSPQLLQRTLDEGYDAALIPNGCDFDHFAAPRARPRDLPDNRLVIGFAGGVSDRIDVELLMSIVDARPEWLFVVAGEVVKTLPERPNLMVVGRQPYMEMPAWLQAFDIGVIPYVEDRRNLDSHPLKALEYLAAGVPVVSVPIEGLRSLAPVVQTASGPAAFLGKLDQLAADKPSAAECRNVARQHSWAARVDALEHLIAVELDTVRVH